MRIMRMAPQYCGVPLFSLLLLAAVGPEKAVAQDVARASSQGVTLAAQSLAALTRGTVVTDAKLQGDVSFASGSDEETGPVTLEASGDLESRVDLSLSGGQRLLIQNGTQATWTGPDGRTHPEALHNSLSWAPWFFPALAVGGLVQDPSFTVSYVGQETDAGLTVQHLRATR